MMKMKHFLLAGICLFAKVYSDNIIKTKISETTNCRRFLNTRTSLICLHEKDETQIVSSEGKLDCGNDTIKDVVAVYAGLKNISTSVCANNPAKTTGRIPKCCQLEINDVLINVNDIKDQLKNKKAGELLKNMTPICQHKRNCSIPRVVVPVTNVLQWRNYSNFIVAEYRCSKDTNIEESGAFGTTIGAVAGGIMFGVVLLMGVIWLRNQLTRATDYDHVNLERKSENPRTATESGYEEMPLADKGVCMEADQPLNDIKLDDTNDQVVRGGCFSSAKEKSSYLDTYNHAVVGSGNDSMKGKTLDADDIYDHAMVGSGSASMKEKTADADDTYDHAMVGSGSASMKEKTADAGDTYDHAVVGSGSASMKEKTADADDTCDHVMV